MRTWDDFIAVTKEEGGSAKEVLELAETTAQIAGAAYLARDKKNISQRELARMAGVAQSVVARFETGATTPRLDTLVKLLSPLGLKLQAVSGEEECQREFVFMDSLSIALVTGRAELTPPDALDWTEQEIKEVCVDA